MTMAEHETAQTSYDDKKRALYLRQKEMLEQFMAKGAISEAQFNKSLHDLTVKMGYGEE